MKAIALFLVLFVFISPLWAQEIDLTLDEAVVLALRNNRDVLLKAEDLKKSKAKIAEANAALFPTLNFSASLSATSGYYAKTLVQDTEQFTLKQYLYKGEKILNIIEQNKYKAEVSSALLAKAKLETVLHVTKAFYALLLSKEFLGLNKSILENTQGHLEVAKARYQKGEASESDILRIDSSLSSAREAYEASLNQLDGTRALLENLLYLDETLKINPAAEFIYQPREVALEEAFLKAMGNRPEIKQYIAQEEADKKAIEIAKADIRPSIYVSGDYYTRSHASAGTSRNRNDYSVAGITLSWPVFDGWLTKAKIEQAISDLKQTRLTKEKTAKDIAMELKDAYLSLKDVIAKIKAEEAEEVFFKDSLSAVEKKYQDGIASSLDLADAHLSYSVSSFNQKQAVYDYLAARADFEKASGAIKEVER